MNLQETLEAMLDKRRQLVGKLTPAEQSRLLHEGLGNLLEQSLYAQGTTLDELSEQHDTLRSLAGCVLYLLHPEDPVKPALETVFGAPSPAPFAALAKAFGEHKPGGILIGEPGSARPQGDEPLPEPPDCGHGMYEDAHEVPFTVVKRGDGTYKRKPRPDRG